MAKGSFLTCLIAFEGFKLVKGTIHILSWKPLCQNDAVVRSSLHLFANFGPGLAGLQGTARSLHPWVRQVSRKYAEVKATKWLFLCIPFPGVPHFRKSWPNIWVCWTIAHHDPSTSSSFCFPMTKNGGWKSVKSLGDKITRSLLV